MYCVSNHSVCLFRICGPENCAKVCIGGILQSTLDHIAHRCPVPSSHTLILCVCACGSTFCDILRMHNCHVWFHTLSVKLGGNRLNPSCAPYSGNWAWNLNSWNWSLGKERREINSLRCSLSLPSALSIKTQDRELKLWIGQGTCA